MQEVTVPPRRGGRALRFFVLGLALIVVVGLVVAWANRDAAALALIASTARRYGYDVAAGSLDVNLSRLTAHDVSVRTTSGEPVLDARDCRVDFSILDLLPGGKRLFGLTAVTLAGPHITLIHHRNGSYNVRLPQAPAAPVAANGPPLDVTVAIGDGSVDLIDRFVDSGGERRERISGIRVDGTIAPARGSAYHAAALLEAGAARYPIVGNARFDGPRGFALQHWTAAELPIAGLANFALNTHAIAIEAGAVRKLDLTVGALAGSGTLGPEHLGLTFELAGGVVAASALTRPIRNARGSFVVDDDSATIRSFDADLNGIALHASGALFAFAAPRVALALTARGDLGRAGTLRADGTKLPLAGAVRVAGLAEGPATSPLVFVRVTAPHAAYGAYRADAVHGFAALSGSALDLIDASARYGAAEVGLRGSVRLAQHTPTAGYARIAVPTDGIPYAANILPGVLLQGLVTTDGRDGKLAVHGYLSGANGPDRLDAPIALDAGGSGTIGPVVLERRDGASVYARALIDRRTNQTVAFGDIAHLSLLPAPHAATLPGVTLPALPAHLDVTVDAALAARAAGTTLQTADGDLRARGGWGELRAVATGSGSGFGARGRLTSSFDRLASYTGSAGVHGGIAVPFALAGNGGTTLVQIAGARFPGAGLRGVALQSANATLGLTGRAVDVYAADVRVGGHDVTARGRFGDGGHVVLTAGDLDLDPARAAGIPVTGGNATVIADIGGSTVRPTAAVVAALAGARYAGTDIGADAGVAYDGSTLHVRSATLNFGAAYVDGGGEIGGIAPGRIAPRYDLRAQVQDADIGTLARAIKNPLRYPAGTLAANVRIAGAGRSPVVSGDVSIPEGSLNGLAFNGGRVGFTATAGSVMARDGRVTVGGTTLRFDGSATSAVQSASLRAPHLDLADFNDYFDEADELAGTGRLRASAHADRRHLAASADVALAGVRYRRIELGRIAATVGTQRSTVSLAGSVDGSNGRLSVNGSVNVPASDPRRDLLRRSDLDLSARLAGVDLGRALPAAGLDPGSAVPAARGLTILGVMDAAATVRGRYPALALETTARVSHGSVGRVPIQRLSFGASAAAGRGRITEASLAVTGLTANLIGTFGLRPQDALDLRLAANSPDLDGFITAVTGHNPDVGGTLATTTTVTGTAAAPRIAATFDAANLTHAAVTVPRVHAELAATRTALELRNGNITLERGGAIAFDGRYPFGGGAAPPITFDFVPRHVDVSPYSALLPSGSVIAGVFDGNVGVRGTVAAPLLDGRLTLRGGAYRSSLLTGGVSAAAADLTFSGTSVRIADLTARLGSGTLDGSGVVIVGDLRDPVRGLQADLALRIAHARIAAPKYYTGDIDGTVTATKRPASALTLGGNLTFSQARIPYTALLPGSGTTSTAAPALPAVDFDLGIVLGRDVRVQSGPVDIGATGSARLGGTLAKPTLAGAFDSTDGTVSLYRTFTVQYGSSVSFDPADGITPSVDATATTNVPDPPTAVLLHVTGLATHLTLDFSSQPVYSQEQILGLLVNAQALGAVSGVAAGGQTGSSGVSVAGLGEGVAVNAFTQRFLQPFSSKLGGALGLSDLDVNYATTGSVSATARRTIGKNVSFVYGEQFGGPIQRTSVGINVGTPVAGAQVTFYQTLGSQAVTAGLTPFLQSGFLSSSTPNYTLLSVEPPTGSGFVFTYQRKYW